MHHHGNSQSVLKIIMDVSSSVAMERELPPEPCTSSDVKEERILARRKRVQAKIEADRRAALGEEPQKVT